MSNFLNKVEAFSLTELQRQSKLMIDKFWRNEHLPQPKFRIVDTPNQKWLGRTIYRSKEPNTSVIEIQKSILNDDTTLKRVLMHELIHHFDFTRNPTDPTKKDLQRNPHDKFFMDEARRINTRLGRDFVTKVSDRTFLSNASKKEFTAVLYDHNGKIGYAHMSYPDSHQQDFLKNLLATNKVRFIKTKESRFLHGPALSENTQFAIPKDVKEQAHLRSLYKGGQKHP